MKHTVDKPVRKRSQKAAAKKNLPIKKQPISAAKDLWADKQSPMFLDSHDADHLAAEKRGYFMALEQIL